MYNYFDISAFGYVSVQSQMQGQNAVWPLRTYRSHGLKCGSVAVSFLGSRVKSLLNARIFFICVVVWCEDNMYRIGR